MNARYIIKKIIGGIIVLLVVIVLNFFLPRMVFADPAMPYYAGVPEDAVALRAAIRAEYGFDKPIMYQFWLYLGRVFALDFGYSHIYKEAVFQVMFRRIPWSMVLSLSSLLISLFAGIVFGAVAARNRGKWQDNVLLKWSTVSAAMPSFWIAIVFVMLFAFAVPVFPHRGAMTSGYALSFNPVVFWSVLAVISAVSVVVYRLTKKAIALFVMLPAGLFVAVVSAVPIIDIIDVAYHSILPLTVVCIGGVVSYALLIRNSMIAVVNEDYILTARAKGLTSSRVLFRHTFKNALLPLVTNLGMSFAGIFGGSVLIEKIFSWPGMGQLLLEANNNGDFQLAQAIMLFFAVVTIAANLCAELIYHKLDPRVKFS